ncbi:ubiquitin-conjugating enzyme E2 W isoform X1 [Pyrgilauda ruficollis]|nr:ubiquitin-conjugating enzyme E2 W isoform X1 [Pyrgilauda ruficollis]
MPPLPGQAREGQRDPCPPGTWGGRSFAGRPGNVCHSERGGAQRDPARGIVGTVTNSSEFLRFWRCNSPAHGGQGQACPAPSRVLPVGFSFSPWCELCGQKRLQKELLAFQNDPPPGMTLDEKSVQNSITQWIVDMEGAPGTLYEGEKFQLLFKFSSRYPFDSPQVMFTGDNIPVHPHVYSNGHICLSILTEDWSPALSVQSVCLSIISMLSSCKEKRRPPDNSFYVRTCNKNPKKTKWWYHDDTC